ncbi:MAG: hypothetical protein EOP56_02060 [Sphingobacteriales bacterium]|nr:MAG: hypothetical protein EOP56_02060 [Sphingobacteriales bacterium]
MKKNFFGFTMLLAIALTACAQQKKTASRVVTTNTDAKAGEFTYVKMHRSPCFGKCPSYTIELYKDGKVKYTGMSDTKYMGTYEKKFDTKTTGTILNKFKTNRADTCSKEYTLMIADIPGIYYEFLIGGERKEIYNAHFGPIYLKNLASEIDRTIGEPGAGWVKTAEPEKRD